MRRLAILAAVMLSLASLAWAFHEGQRERVRSLASQLVQATDRLNRDAQADRDRYDEREDGALRSVFELAAAAQWFALQVDRYRPDLERTRDDFRWVDRSHRTAAGLFRDRASGRVGRDFVAVDDLMDRLRPLYGVDAWARRRSREPARRGHAFVTVPAGSALTVALEHAIRSRDMPAGHTFAVEVAEDVVEDGWVAIPAGTKAVARVVEMKKAGRVEGRERISVEVVELRLGGEVLPVNTNVVTFVAEGSGERDAAVIGGSAAIGALIGAIADEGEGALKGAAAGAAAGTGVVLATRGRTVRLPAGHRIDFLLDQDLRVRVPGDEERPSGDISERDR